MTDPASDSSRPLRIVLIYATFAALWILLSDSAVKWLFADPGMILLVSTIKGWLFVAVTSLLLYLLLQHGRPEKVDADTTARRSWRGLPFLLAGGVIVGLVAVGITYTVEHQKQTEMARLQAVADLKVEMIQGWFKERMSDAAFVKSSVFFAEQYRLWQLGREASGDQLKARLGQFRTARSFTGMMLLGPTGQLLWHSENTGADLPAALLAAATQAARDHQLAHIGPYRDSQGKVHLDFVAPLATDGDQLTPVAVLHAEPDDWLFPAMQHWPIPSASGETLLFRRDGNDVLFLNELRYRSDTAAKLRIAIDAKDVLAVQVLRGDAKDGQVVTGHDYRGVPVIGVVRAIPGTDWFMIAKLDKAEVFAEAAKDSAWLTMGGVLALFMLYAALIMLRQQSRLQLAEAERTADARYRALVEQSLAGIYIIQDGHFRYVNPGFARMFGYASPADLIDQAPVAELIAPEDRQKVIDNIRDRIDGRIADIHYTFAGLRRDGSRIHLEVHGRAFDYEGRPAVIGLILDITARRQAEEKLRLWAESFEQADFALAIADAQTNTFLAVNPTFARERGYTQGELVGMPIMSVYPPDQIAQTKDKIAALEEVGHGVFEGEHVAKDGRRFPVLMDITVIKSADGQPQTRIAYALDITDRKRVDAVLRASEKRFHDIVEATADWVWEVDGAGRYTYASENVHDLLGYTAEELIGKTPFDFMPPEEAQRVRVQFEAIAAARRPFRDLDNINVRKDGALRHVSTNGMPIFDTNGNLIGYRGLDRDVTEQKLAEAALLATRDQLRAVINAIPDLIWLKDPQGRYLTCNARFESFFGASEAEILGKTDYDFVSRELADFFRANDQAALAAGRPTENEEEVTFASDGHRELLQTVKTPFHDSTGRLVGVLGVARDITERRQAERNLTELADNLSATLHAVPDLLFEVDGEGHYLDIHATRPELLALPAAQLLGRTLREVLPPAAAEICMEAVAAADAVGTDYGRVMRLPLPHGDHYFELSAARKPAVVGQPQRFVVLSRDVTDRIEAIEQLRVRNEELERFNRATVDRELDMIELKQQINALAAQLGQAAPYDLGFIDLADKGKDGAR